ISPMAAGPLTTDDWSGALAKSRSSASGERQSRKPSTSPLLKAALLRRTISTFSCDIAQEYLASCARRWSESEAKAWRASAQRVRSAGLVAQRVAGRARRVGDGAGHDANDQS